jgi:hypothetical protein
MKYAHKMAVLLFLTTLGATAQCDNNLVHSKWMLIDNFEHPNAIEQWTLLDTKNETQPVIHNPQVTEVRSGSSGNHYLIKKPAAEGIVGNRKALTFRPLPVVVGVGEVYTFYTRFQVESFPNNHIFGLSNLDAKGIAAQDYNAIEPSLRITDKAESNGYKNDGSLMVKLGDGYKKVINFATAEVAQPLQTAVWYEVWYVVNNNRVAEGGQVYDVYLKGGEFEQQTPVYLNADFRMRREKPLTYLLLNCNTGPKHAPYGNGGILYDDFFTSAGKNLSSPIANIH